MKGNFETIVRIKQEINKKKMLVKGLKPYTYTRSCIEAIQTTFIIQNVYLHIPLKKKI
jgi:hypothetical protein